VLLFVSEKLDVDFGESSVKSNTIPISVSVTINVSLCAVVTNYVRCGDVGGVIGYD